MFTVSVIFAGYGFSPGFKIVNRLIGELIFGLIIMNLTLGSNLRSLPLSGVHLAHSLTWPGLLEA